MPATGKTNSKTAEFWRRLYRALRAEVQPEDATTDYEDSRRIKQMPSATAEPVHGGSQVASRRSAEPRIARDAASTSLTWDQFKKESEERRRAWFRRVAEERDEESRKLTELFNELEAEHSR